MCVAGLNVSTQPCHHRWYELVRPCSTNSNLSNCAARLKLEGWERRTETCPWCDEGAEQVSGATHRLFGSLSNPSSTPSSPTSQEFWGRGRSGSGGTMPSLSRHNSAMSMESERGQKHRDMNERLSLYLTMSPHEVLPSAKKNYPSPIVLPVDADQTSEVCSARNATGLLRKRWRKSIRYSMGIFKN